jgi:hypothetical protein
VADIDIQEKRGQPTWVWIVAIIALVAVVAVIWALVSNGDDRTDGRLQRDTVPAARDTPVGWLDRADDAMPEFVLASGPARRGGDGVGAQ